MMNRFFFAGVELLLLLLLVVVVVLLLLSRARRWRTRDAMMMKITVFLSSFFLSFSVFVTSTDFSLFSFFLHHHLASSSLLNKVARRRGGGHVRRGRRKLPEGRAARPHGATREWR